MEAIKVHLKRKELQVNVAEKCNGGGERKMLKRLVRKSRVG